MRQRELTFCMNEDMQRELEATLHLKAPVQVNVSTDSKRGLRGTYTPGRRIITLEIALDLFANSSLIACKREIVQTLLHEFRHAWQEDHWTPERIAKDHHRSYEDREVEKDAREYAAANVAFWLALGDLRPKRVYSKLRRLAEVERGMT